MHKGGAMSKNTNVNIFIDSQKITVSNLTLNIMREAGNHTAVSIRGIVQSDSYEILSNINSMTDILINPEEMQALFSAE